MFAVPHAYWKLGSCNTLRMATFSLHNFPFSVLQNPVYGIRA